MSPSRTYARKHSPAERHQESKCRLQFVTIKLCDIDYNGRIEKSFMLVIGHWFCVESVYISAMYKFIARTLTEITFCIFQLSFEDALSWESRPRKQKKKTNAFIFFLVVEKILKTFAGWPNNYVRPPNCVIFVLWSVNDFFFRLQRAREFMKEQCAPGKDSFILMVHLVMEVMDNPDCTLLCTVQGVAGKHFRYSFLQI